MLDWGSMVMQKQKKHSIAGYAWLVGMAVLSSSHLANAADPRNGPAEVLAQSPTKAPAPISLPAKSILEQREIRAQLAPYRSTTLAAEIGAKIRSLPVKEGGAFKSGQSLVSFDCSLQQAQLNRARAALSGAEATYKGNQRLMEFGTIGKIEMEVSETEVAKSRADVGTTSTMLSKCNIPAPFSGRVAELKVREQQYVQPGQPIMEIIDDSVLEIEFLVPSKWLAWIKAGTKLSIAIDETRKDYPAQIQRISARVDPVSQSVKLVATIDGRYPDLIAGMSGRINLAPPPGM